jgi:hypothetical protein
VPRRLKIGRAPARSGWTWDRVWRAALRRGRSSLRERSRETAALQKTARLAGLLGYSPRQIDRSSQTTSSTALAAPPAEYAARVLFSGAGRQQDAICTRP